jgi:hypothetical protein
MTIISLIAGIVNQADGADGAQPQSLKKSKPDLSSEDATDQQVLDGWVDSWTLLPDRKEDRSLHEGVLSLLDDHSSNICC